MKQNRGKSKINLPVAFKTIKESFSYKGRRMTQPIFSDLLNNSQKEVLEEVYKRGMQSGGLSLPLGFGKTRLSLILGIKYNQGPVLVVVSKTLLASWLDEIEKTFGKTLQVEVMHRNFLHKAYNTWQLRPNIQIVLTTPEVLYEAYTRYALQEKLMKYVQTGDFTPPVICYKPPTTPLLQQDQLGPGNLFSRMFGCLLIDELQLYTNILCGKSRALACLSAHHKWGLSGTMFDEPKPARFLGFFVVLGVKGPRELRKVFPFLSNAQSFRGFYEYLVHREDNKEFSERPEYREMIVTHPLSATEANIFQKFRNVLKFLQTQVRDFKVNREIDKARKFSAYLLSMITFFRQALICPGIPIATAYRDIAEGKSESELSRILVENFRDMGLTKDYLQDERNLLSSRFQSVLQKINEHKKDKCIVFSAFRSTVSLFTTFIKDRPVMTITADMTTEKRRLVLKDFEDSENAIMLLPYSIGAEGLNMQHASVVMIMDLWWNDPKMQQAIGRVFRPGQKASTVFVYMFVSDTGIENKIIEKFDLKSQILCTLHCQPANNMHVPRMSMNEIINIINLEDNKQRLEKARVKRKVEMLKEEDEEVFEIEGLLRMIN